VFDSDDGDINDDKSAENAERNQKPFDIQPVACRAPAQGDYAIVTIIHQEPAIRCGLSQGPPVPCCELQSVLGNSSYKL
jgi:hypothetical protein